MSSRPALDDINALVRWHQEQLGFGPADLARRREATERAQFKRWGVTGLAILNTINDEDWSRLLGTWQGTEFTTELQEIDDIFAQLLEGEANAAEPR
jgi:hypothetical protein